MVLCTITTVNMFYICIAQKVLVDEVTGSMSKLWRNHMNFDSIFVRK